MINKLRGMAVFSAVVDAGSFRGAADRLNLSVSVVSHHVALLESALNVKLIYRSTRQLSLTEQGRSFYAHCKEMICAANAALESLERRVSGRLRVVVPPGYAHSTFIDHVSEFCQRYPEIELELDFDYAQRNLIRDGIDVAIGFGSANAPDFVARKLYSLEMNAYASPQCSDLLEGSPDADEDLFARCSWICLNSFEKLRFTDSRGQSRSALPWARVCVNSLSAQIALTISGLGLALLPAAAARKSVEQGLLVRVLPEIKAEPIVCSVFFPSRPGTNSLSRLFVDFISARQGEFAQLFDYK